jgi:hypothetical protein
MTLSTTPLLSHLYRRALQPGLFALVTAISSLNSVQAETVFRAEDTLPFSATYTVGNNLLSAGNATLTLEQGDNDLWTYQLKTQPTGVFKLTGKGNITETSVLRFVEAPEGGLLLRTDSYSYRQDDERRRSVDAAFDWENQTLGWSRRGKTGTASLADGPVVDRLSVTLDVMSALRQNIDTIEYRVFDNGRLKDVVFKVEGIERLETSIGEMDTVRVLRTRVDGSSRTTVTWFAPSLDYVPVKIEQLKRGELVARLTLKSLSNRAADLKEPLIEPEAPVAD